MTALDREHCKVANSFLSGGKITRGVGEGGRGIGEGEWEGVKSAPGFTEFEKKE